jgi:hypothetical protein
MLLARLRLNISYQKASWQTRNLQTAPRSAGYPAKHWTEEYFHLNFFSVSASITVLQDFRPKAAPQLPMLTKFRHNGASQIQNSAQLLL